MNNEYMKKVNVFRTKLLLTVSNELNKDIKRTLMKLNSKNINDINSNFSINSFEVFMENPIEIGQPSNYGSKSDFENSSIKKKKTHQKINSFLNLLSIDKQNKKKLERKTTRYDIILVKKKNISQLKKSLGPKTVKTKKKQIKFSKKYLMKKSIKYLKQLINNLKDLEGKNKINYDKAKSQRNVNKQFIHNILRDNILNDAYLIGEPNYSPLIYYNQKK
jgi:hypothetical protein